MVSDYWIRRVEELQEKNSQLKEKLAELGESCIHFDGKECRNIQSRGTGEDCEYCPYYEVFIDD